MGVSRTELPKDETVSAWLVEDDVSVSALGKEVVVRVSCHTDDLE